MGQGIMICSLSKLTSNAGSSGGDMTFDIACGMGAILVSIPTSLASWKHAPILPKLSSVAFCHLMRQDLCPGAFALISPSVRKLNFSIKSVHAWPPFDEKLRFVFSRTFDAAPQIEGIRLELLPTRLGAPLLQAHCSRVRHIEVFPQLDFEDLAALAELPALQHLSVSLDLKPSTPEVASVLVFKSVTTLAIKGIWTELSRALTAIMRLLVLHSLVVEGWHHGDPAAELARDATECFRTISGHISVTSLSISTDYGRLPENLNTGCVMYGIADVEMPLLDFMHPLLSLSALRDVSLSFPVYFNLACTSSDLRAIAESWPALEALHLLVAEYRADADSFEFKLHPSGGPLEAIAHFARHCPRLRILHLSAMEMGQDALAAAVGLLGPALVSYQDRPRVSVDVHISSHTS
ncbi:hypothetical protein GSI_11502 [Ganoderma sinense ZZ0214-1]|uniref:F-box domain-containing protein n=1 Tax=Ganoderma sinense ZZ0214-1 TaxID=1077348 RepID=A0A2G8RW65_9APHY|nr:hypothetical protein GSI_11502 [Ganoderma sinense ZZ0214-1]